MYRTQWSLVSWLSIRLFLLFSNSQMFWNILTLYPLDTQRQRYNKGYNNDIGKNELRRGRIACQSDKKLLSFDFHLFESINMSWKQYYESERYCSRGYNYKYVRIKHCSRLFKGGIAFLICMKYANTF